MKGDAGQGGKAPHGSQYFTLEDTGGFAYVQLDPVAVADYTDLWMTGWAHVEATTWELSDLVKVWATDTGTGDEVLLVKTCHRDNMKLDWNGPNKAGAVLETAHAVYGPTIHNSPELSNLEVVAADPLDGCKPLKGNYTNKIVLISRGACRFDLQTYHAQAAFAQAAVIYKYGDVLEGNQVVNGKKLTIPAVSISTVQGEAILAATKKGTTRASIHCGTVSDHTKYPVRHSLVMNKWEQYSARLSGFNSTAVMAFGMQSDTKEEEAW